MAIQAPLNEFTPALYINYHRKLICQINIFKNRDKMLSRKIKAKISAKTILFNGCHLKTRRHIGDLTTVYSSGAKF